MVDIIKDTIDRFTIGFVFATIFFSVKVSERKSFNKFINVLVTQRKIWCLSKGRFYKSQINEFGKLLPDNKGSG